MKASAIRHNNLPMVANRSPRYFGIDLFLEQSFFTATADGKCGLPRPDPRIKGFCRTTQNKLRDRLNSAATKFGFTLDDADCEWKSIVRLATKAATAKMSETGLGSHPDNPITRREGQSKIKDAFKVACRVAAGIVHERESDSDSWEYADGQQHFPLLADEMFIYIFRDSPTSAFYKIGKTTDLQRRIAEYKTHNREFVVLQSYPSRRGLTERLIHDYFSSKRDGGEFFRLTDQDVDLVTNPTAMSAAIRQLGDNSEPVKRRAV
jgi:predicted GIY-YIG superfamily endonuclease